MPIELPSKFEPLFTPSRYKASWSGRGAGKSHSFAEALVIRGAQKPLQILCCREIQKSIRDSVKRLIDDKIRDSGLSGFYKSTDTEVKGKNGTLFTFAGLRTNPESIKSTEGVDVAWVEEANTVSRRSLDLLIPTVRKEGSELWFTWNPDSEFDPVDQMFRGEHCPPDSILIAASYLDNPWFPEVLRKEMEFDKSVNMGKYRHVWLGEYSDAQEGKMYTNDILDWQTQFLQDGMQIGDWFVYETTYNPKFKYALGADVAEGLGLDSSTACLLNLTMGTVVAEYASSRIEPDMFAHELLNFANKYGGCIIAPERNSCGLTTVTKLNELGALVYYEEEKESGQDKPTKRLGWRTTAKSKPLMLYDLKDALSEKLLAVNSRRIYKELKTYNPEDMRNIRFDPEQTKHWDRVMALAIAWQMRDVAQVKTVTGSIMEAQKRYINSK